jgi:hypothetical protein
MFLSIDGKHLIISETFLNTIENLKKTDHIIFVIDLR